jgi:dipeptidyl aminopeptidase/acylaminoacyl peptidase
MTNGPIAYETARTPTTIALTTPGDGGGTLIAVGPTDRDPSWNATGDQLAFTSTRDGNEEIYVAGSDGTNQRRLTFDGARDDDPSWSPDGTQIAFMSTRAGDPNIYVMNADGSNVRRLTSDPAADQQPAWSPDGALIAFTSERDGNREIYVMRPDGSGQQRLTKAPVTDADPSWSPDGLQIAFTEGNPGQFDVFVMDRDATTARQLTTEPSDDHFPCWSPDGKQIAFTSDRGSSGIDMVYAMPAQGGGAPAAMAVGRDENWAPINLPPPVTVPAPASSANAATLLGQVFVRSDPTKAVAVAPPVPLESPASVPSGANVDATRGVVGLLVNSGSQQAPVVSTAAATGARFTLTLASRSATLTLLGALPALRIRTDVSVASAQSAIMARRARRRHRRPRRPRCTYNVKTRYAKAAGCGTAWTTAVQPDGTLVTVTSGVVLVDDYGRHRSVLVAGRRGDLRGRAGVVGRYFAAR